MPDNCAACCKAYTQHIESERAGRLDLERRFDKAMNEQFIRRGLITRLQHALQDKTAALIRAESTIEGLSGTLANWHELAASNPQIPLSIAFKAVLELRDPLDVEKLEFLPAAKDQVAPDGCNMNELPLSASAAAQEMKAAFEIDIKTIRKVEGFPHAFMTESNGEYRSHYLRRHWAIWQRAWLQGSQSLMTKLKPTGEAA